MVKTKNQSTIIGIEDYDPQEMFVLLDSPYKEKILVAALKKAGSQSKLSNLIRENLRYPLMRQSTVSYLIKKETLRLDLARWLCAFTGIPFDQKRIIGLKGSQTSGMLLDPNLEISLSPELAQIVANLYCDGTIHAFNHIGTYYNNYIELIDRFERNVNKVFGTIKLPRFRTNVHAINIPAFLGKMICHKFHLREDRVPPQIQAASPSIKAAYLQAAFDDEGGVHKSHGQIRIKMKPQSYIEDIWALVREFDIEISEIFRETDRRNGREYHYFLISGIRNLRKFHENIGFYHPIRRKIVLSHIANVKMENYGYNARYLVLSTLRKNGNLTAKEIAERIKRGKRTVHQHLRKLRREQLVEFSRAKRRFVYEYIWKVV